MSRSVVFLFTDYSLHNAIVSDYVAARPDDRVAVVKVPLVLKGRSRSDTARRIVPQLSRRFIAGKALEFLVLLTLTLLPKLMRSGAVFRRLRWIARRHGLPFLKTDNVMSSEALDFVRAQQPDVVVTVVHQILKDPLITIPRFGVVNIHPGLLPGFRGIQPYFWELSEGSALAGPTLHLIEDEGIDTGRLLVQSPYPVQPRMSVQRNYFLTARAAAAILPECVDKLCQGQLTPRAQDPDTGAYYRWPDGVAFDRLKSRGHCLFSWRQLWRILAGDGDSSS